MTVQTVLTRRRRLFACCFAVGLTLVGAVASAQLGSGRVFERLDTDRSDVLEPREIEAARRTTFDRADANNDDYVSGPEIEALRDELAEEYGRGGAARPRAPEGARQALTDRIKALDTDGDGRIAHAEFMSGRNPLAQRFDGNGDGSITRAEMDEGASDVREQIRRRRGR